MSVPVSLYIKFTSEREAVTELCNAACHDDINYVVEILNDEQAFKQVRNYLLLRDRVDINIRWALDTIRCTLNDRKDEYECRPTQLGDARLALYRLMLDANLGTLKVAMWVCETHSPFSRIVHVSALQLLPAFLVN